MNPNDANGQPTPRNAAGELSLLALASFVLRHRAILIGVPLVVALGTLTYQLSRARTYTSVASFAPQSKAPEAGNLAGIAAQFGVSRGGAQPAHSPAFYAELVRSRTILGRIADTSFSPAAGAPPVTLAEVYDIRVRSPERAREEVIEELRRDVSARASRETGVVFMQVRAETPALAHAISTRVFDLLNEFNVSTRQSQARTEREFVQSLLENAEADLLSAEREQQAFLQANRQYSRSPELVFQHDRLAREVSSRQQLLDALRQRYEQARIDEVRDVPLITMLEEPSLPAKGDGRGTVGRLLIALVAGSLLALALALVREILQRGRNSSSEEYLQFVRLRDQAFPALGRRRSGSAEDVTR
jgi:uncharacterized protein involved in exopolysaccharide biosynthesis